MRHIYLILRGSRLATLTGLGQLMLADLLTINLKLRIISR